MKKYIITLTLLLTCFLSQAQELISGSYDSFGRIIYDNGQEYIGELKNGDPHGYGSTLYSNGQMYLGEYNNGKKHGYGIVIFNNGNRFIGTFKNGQENGYAVKKEEGNLLASQWIDGVMRYKSVKKIGDNTGCILGKCDVGRTDGISVNQKEIKIGNPNKVINCSKNYGYIYIGQVRNKQEYGVGLEAYVSNAYPYTHWIELKNKKSGTWTSYYVNSDKEIYLRNWIDDKMIQEDLLNDRNTNTKISAPPFLIPENILFSDFNSNNLLEANEQATITFNLKNTGKGSAYGIIIQVNDNNNTQGLSYDRTRQIDILKPQGSNFITIPVSASMNLSTGTANFNVTISEGNGFDAEQINMAISTQSFIPPKLEIVDHVFSSQSGVIKPMAECNLQFAVQNIGQGTAEDIKIKIVIPKEVFPGDETVYLIDRLNPGEKKLFDFPFFTNRRFTADILNITAKISEKYGKYASDKIMSSPMNKDISNAIALKIESDVTIENTKIERFSLRSDVDKEIPKNKKVENRFALVIGNEDYSTHHTSLRSEQNVDHAVNDATVFKKYCLNTLGVKEENMILLTNATSGKMNGRIDLITNLVKATGKDSELIVYYAGHGYPDETTRVPYLIPVDVSASDLSSAIKLDDFYKKLVESKASKITVFLDACFTGGGRNSGLVASRGVTVKPKEGSLNGNIVVFSASSEDQSSLPYAAEGHGMFTYYLLKKLQETKGEISMGELADYLEDKVAIQSLRVNESKQKPKTHVSENVKNDWKNWKFQK